jgi:hypothetical protein
MKPLPASEATLVIRTDFSDPGAWQTIRSEIQAPAGLFRANVTFVDDPEYDGVGLDELSSLVAGDPQRTYFILADRTAMEHAEHPVLVVDVFDPPMAPFRAIPTEIPGIETNLSLGNMDADDFAGAADPDGIFRGFRR